MPDTAEQVYEFWAPVKFAWQGIVEFGEFPMDDGDYRWHSRTNVLSPDDAAALIRDAVARWLHGKGVNVVCSRYKMTDGWGFAFGVVNHANLEIDTADTYDEALRAAAREVGE